MSSQTPLRTRSGINSRLLSLSNKNLELEQRLEEAERACQRYRIKTNVQNVLITELVDAIHSIAQSSDGNNSNTVVTEDTCLLLTKNAQRISNLSMELETMKLQAHERAVASNSTNDNSEHDDLSDCGNDRIEHTHLGDNHVKEESSASPLVDKVVIKRLKEENMYFKSKCESLERSMVTLKHKHTESEVRSMVSLKNVRRQLDEMEQERKRRINMQATAEERALRLEKEISDISRKREGLVRPRRRRQQLLGQTKSELSLEENEQNEDEILYYSSSPASSVNSDTSTDSINTEKKTEVFAKCLTRCREAVVLRNQVFRISSDFCPPPLVAVSEDSEDDGSDTDSVLQLRNRRGSF